MKAFYANLNGSVHNSREMEAKKKRRSGKYRAPSKDL